MFDRNFQFEMESTKSSEDGNLEAEREDRESLRREYQNITEELVASWLEENDYDQKMSNEVENDEIDGFKIGDFKNLIGKCLGELPEGTTSKSFLKDFPEVINT